MYNVKNFKFIFLAVIVVISAVAGSFMHRHIHQQSPEYALSEIRKSLDNHDMKTFEKYVDIDTVVENAYPVLMEGLVVSKTDDRKDVPNAMDNIFQVMKDPIIASFKTNIEKYVVTGNWTQENGKETEASELLTRSGLNKLEFHNIKGITSTEEKNIVIANILVYQHEINSEFVFEAVLVKNETGIWRVTDIRNFRDFMQTVSQIRQEQMHEYMQETGDIIEKHDEVIHEAEIKYGDILSAGSLGDQNTRDSLKNLLTDVIQKDWEERKQELFTIEVPESAQSLHHIRLRICDLHIEHAKKYALWMTDKKATTIREADSKLKEAKTLEQEERLLSKKINILIQTQYP